MLMRLHGQNFQQLLAEADPVLVMVGFCQRRFDATSDRDAVRPVREPECGPDGQQQPHV